MDYTKKPLILVLAGVLLGLVVGLEFAHQSIGGVCPQPACVGGGELTPVTDRDYAPTVIPLLRSARDSIHIASMELKYYESYPNSSVNHIVRELIAAHERGVEVMILLDEYSEVNNAFDLLREAGLDVRWDNNQTTTHAKLIIIDGKIVLLGSTNLSFYGLEKNHEANVLIRDPETTAHYEDYFQRLWASS